MTLYTINNYGTILYNRHNSINNQVTLRLVKSFRLKLKSVSRLMLRMDTVWKYNILSNSFQIWHLVQGSTDDGYDF